MGSRKQRARQVQSAAAGAAAGDDDQAAAAAAAGGKVSGLEYLVSWKELPLEQASWEAVEVCVVAAGFWCGHPPIHLGGWLSVEREGMACSSCRVCSLGTR